MKYLLLLILIVGSSSLLAEEQAAGKTLMARGEVNATAASQTRALKRRSPVYVADDVATGLSSASQLRMSDGGLLSLQEDSLLRIASYVAASDSERGDINMSLLKGGLRTVTGAIQSLGGDYKLNTPVASIGVRGTHFEAELIDNDLYLAGWEGIIDVSVTVPGKAQQFSLGPDQDYRFAIVRANGDVEFVLSTPTAFASGHTVADVSQATLTQPAVDLTQSNFDAYSELTLDIYPDKDKANKEFVDNDVFVANWLPGDEDIQNRSGVVSFDSVMESSISSSLGDVSNLDVAMEIDFDTAIVPIGQISFDDTGGQWFAIFNGAIIENGLDLTINFASHGNNIADGTINGIFINNGQGIFSNLDLFEVDNPGVNAGGTLILTDGDL